MHAGHVEHVFFAVTLAAMGYLCLEAVMLAAQASELFTSVANLCAV
jgi:hypothetical protein